jgi:hypothetical protein
MATSAAAVMPADSCGGATARRFAGGEGRICVDAAEYVRAHPDAATLTVGGCTINLSPEAPQLATIAIRVRRPGPLIVRIAVAGKDRALLLDEKLKLDVTQPSHMFKPHVIPSADVTIAAHGGLTVRFRASRSRRAGSA